MRSQPEEGGACAVEQNQKQTLDSGPSDATAETGQLSHTVESVGGGGGAAPPPDFELTREQHRAPWIRQQVSSGVARNRGEEKAGLRDALKNAIARLEEERTFSAEVWPTASWTLGWSHRQERHERRGHRKSFVLSQRGDGQAAKQHQESSCEMQAG